MIHPTAIIGEGVHIGEGTQIKAHCVLEGPNLFIGKNNMIGPNVYLKSHTSIGDGNKIYPFSSIGCEPQDLKFKGEDSVVEIGNFNMIREGVTINRGTAHGGGVTKIGNHNLLMAYVHVAHDCILGNHVVLANNVALAGHVTIEDHVIIGGLVGISQFCRIGQFSYMGGCTATNKDVPPFVLTSGSAYHLSLRGINSIGLKRHGVDDISIRQLKEAFKILFLGDLTLKQALDKIKNDALIETPHVQLLVQFIEGSKQGVLGEVDVNGTENKSRRDWNRTSRQLSY